MARKPKPEAHLVIQYILDHCRLRRYEIAAKLGITRKTMYEWEYQLVNIRDYMVEDIAKAAEYPLDRVPENVRENAITADLKRRKPKSEPPRIPKNPAADSMKAEDARTTQRKEKDARLAEALKSPKTPPRDLEHLVNPRSWEDWPDRVKPLLDPLPPYEMVLTPRHWVPYPSSANGLILRDAAWWFKTSKGICQSRATREKALELIEDLRKKDAEALSLDLI